MVVLNLIFSNQFIYLEHITAQCFVCLIIFLSLDTIILVVCESIRYETSFIAKDHFTLKNQHHTIDDSCALNMLTSFILLIKFCKDANRNTYLKYSNQSMDEYLLRTSLFLYRCWRFFVWPQQFCSVHRPVLGLSHFLVI